MHEQITTLSLALVLMFTLCTSTAAVEHKGAQRPEPNAEIARVWWPEFENVWTPIGWKDHTLRGKLLFNGILVIEPKKKPYRGQGVQLEFIPSNSGAIPEPLNEYYPLARKYGPVGKQGWNDGAAPELWTQ